MKSTRLALPILAASLLIAGCSTVSTSSDEVALHYSAGSFSDTKFSECIGTGTRHNTDGPGDLHYVYPQGQHTYKFDTSKGSEQGPLTVVTSDNVRMAVTGILNFQLNTDCKTLRQFHERIGLKYGAEDGKTPTKWAELLIDYLGKPLQTVMVATAHHYTWSQLYNDDATRIKWINEATSLLPDEVKSLAKGDYFSGFTMLVPQPQPPTALLNQIQEQQVQASRIATINAQKAAQEAEIAQIKQLVQVLGPDGYILYRNQVACEQDSKSCVPFLPVPQGGNINVTPSR